MYEPPPPPASSITPQTRAARSAASGLLLVALALFFPPQPVEAMGAFGEDAPTTRIPEPSENFRVKVTDSEMNSFEVTKVSFNGYTYITGYVGKAKLSVPFARIASVIFEPAGDKKVLALVSLKSGEQQQMLVSADVSCYGISTFGNISIEVEDLRDATFLAKIPK